MKNNVRALLLAAAAALASCSTDARPGGTNVEEGSAKTTVPTHPVAASQDSVVAGLHREAHPRPTREQLYDSANQTIDRNRDGKADQ